MELKRSHSWRAVDGYQHRFTYNGFLNCSCGALIYTKYRREDYYVCKDRCGAHYQRRDRLEPLLDELLTQRLTRVGYLRLILKTLRQKRPSINTEALNDQLKRLEAKRLRVLDSYFEGVLSTVERDEKLNEILVNKRMITNALARELPQREITVEALVSAFAPFREFEFLERADKRKLLNTITPSIVAANYEISGLWIGIRDGHMGKDSLVDAFLTLKTRLWLPLSLKAA
jgi:hypothetical protein